MSSRPGEHTEDFSSRAASGRALAPLLASQAGPNMVLMAIPRGGVPVAVEIAAKLSLPLHAFVVERIQAPCHDDWQPRLAIGASAPGGVEVLDAERIQEIWISAADVRLATECARLEQTHKEALYAASSPLPSVRDCTVILIDDAVETGATMRAAIQSLRSMGATEFVIAAPIVAEPAYRALSALASKVFCLKTSPPGSAVHTTYAHFPPVTDADALALLEAHGKQRLAAALNGEDAGAEI